MNIIPLENLLIPATPGAFKMEKGVRIIDHLDYELHYPYLKKKPQDFPLGDATSKDYYTYLPPVLLCEPEKPNHFIYCIGYRRIFVKKQIRVYHIKPTRPLTLDYFIYQLSIQEANNLPFNQWSITCPILSEQQKILQKYGHLEYKDTHSLPPGHILCNGTYIIRKVLGNGFFGITYQADIHAPGTPEHGKAIAIKELYIQNFCYRHPETGHVEFTQNLDDYYYVRIARKKFEGEITKNQLCNSSRIIRIKSTFEENNTLYYTMEYIPGKTLEELMDEKHVLTEEEALHHVREVALALKEMHAKQMLHLDIKPSNILIRESGETILIDFGATKQYDDYGYACTGNPLISTQGFESPEVVRGELTTFLPQADIYSLGLTFYYLLTHSLPRTRREMHCRLKSFSSTTSKAIELAVQYDDNKRLMTADDFINVLDGHNPSELLKEPKEVNIFSSSPNNESGFF